MLNKIPLQPFIQILQNLYDSGADYIDISGENGKDDDDNKRDVIRIAVKPEYMTDVDTFQEVELDYTDEEEEEDISEERQIKKARRKDTNDEALSDEDFDDLI